MALHFKLCFIFLLWLLCTKLTTSQAPASSPAPGSDASPSKPNDPSPPPPPPSLLAPPPPPPKLAPQPPPNVQHPGWKGPSSGLSGGQKAGVVIGTLAGAGLLVFGGMVYKKRRSNIRRARFGSAARRAAL